MCIYLGRANLLLTAQKQYLQQQTIELNSLKATIANTEKKTDELDAEAENVEMELEKAQDKYNAVKELKENYKVIMLNIILN